MNNEPQTADAVRDAVRGVVADMRARERALWGGEPPRQGARRSRRASARRRSTPDAPPPRGAPSRPRPETAAYYTPPAALREANSRAAGERPGCLAFAAGCACGAVAALVARLILEALR